MKATKKGYKHWHRPAGSKFIKKFYPRDVWEEWTAKIDALNGEDRRY